MFEVQLEKVATWRFNSLLAFLEELIPRRNVLSTYFSAAKLRGGDPDDLARRSDDDREDFDFDELERIFRSEYRWALQ
jgi:hypothetical protein